MENTLKASIGTDRPCRSVENLIQRTGNQLNHIGTSLERINGVLERLQTGTRDTDLDVSKLEPGDTPELSQLASNIDSMEQSLDQLSQLVTQLEAL